MSMQMQLLAKLLNSSKGLLYSAYLAFTISLVLLIWHRQSLILDSLFCLICLLLIALQHFVSIRVQFDADILEMLSQPSNETHHHAQLESLTTELDQSLIALNLMPPAKANRTWTVRLQACKSLFRLQVLLLVLQYSVFICIFLLYR